MDGLLEVGPIEIVRMKRLMVDAIPIVRNRDSPPPTDRL